MLCFSLRRFVCDVNCSFRRDVAFVSFSSILVCNSALLSCCSFKACFPCSNFALMVFSMLVVLLFKRLSFLLAANRSLESVSVDSIFIFSSHCFFATSPLSIFFAILLLFSCTNSSVIFSLRVITLRIFDLTAMPNRCDSFSNVFNASAPRLILSQDFSSRLFCVSSNIFVRRSRADWTRSSISFSNNRASSSRCFVTVSTFSRMLSERIANFTDFWHMSSFFCFMAFATRSSLPLLCQFSQFSFSRPSLLEHGYGFLGDIMLLPLMGDWRRLLRLWEADFSFSVMEARVGASRGLCDSSFVWIGDFNVAF
mmetsp:Transcript_13589/g.17093  ORF Transcript_13589/g.17093 Transcript_13589/m.17093 type:complete len:311 (-) Transcript_13589:128-1060(-)